MRLTDHTDYSLRVLMYLNQKKKLVTLNELSEKLAVSKNNLIKVSNQLAKLGLIETTKGRAGGLTLSKEAGQTSLKEIICRTEETFFVAECFAEKRCECTFLRNCLLRATLRDALNAFLTALERKTLDDVTPKFGV
jgi:Rrf2 family nitric oxide-sensitive transcriptional repressor